MTQALVDGLLDSASAQAAAREAKAREAIRLRVEILSELNLFKVEYIVVGYSSGLRGKKL
ncbi:MAG: hypothetical protein VX228_06575 [Pseudomonadota bacterium]|nr:hypothetical protein [Pseudomonadota bacterium]